MKTNLVFLLLTLTLYACQPAAENPRAVAEQFWQAMTAGETERARAFVSETSRPSFDSYVSLPADERTTLDQVTLGTAETRIVTVLYPDASAPDTYRAFETYMVLEQGQWKIDAGRSMIPETAKATDRELEILAQELSESMRRNLDSMEDTMSEGMRMLNDALREGSKEMGESLLKGMEEMNRAMRESIEEMHKRREERQTPPAPGANGAPDKGEGVI